MQFEFGLKNPTGGKASLKYYDVNTNENENGYALQKDEKSDEWQDACYPYGGSPEASYVTDYRYKWLSSDAQDQEAQSEFELLEFTVEIPKGSPVGTYTLSIFDGTGYEFFTANQKFQKTVPDVLDFTVEIKDGEGPIIPADSIKLELESVEVFTSDITPIVFSAYSDGDEGDTEWGVVQVPLTLIKSAPISGMVVQFNLDANLQYITKKGKDVPAAFKAGTLANEGTSLFNSANGKYAWAAPGGLGMVPEDGVDVGVFNILVPLVDGEYEFGFDIESAQYQIPGTTDTAPLGIVTSEAAIIKVIDDSVVAKEEIDLAIEKVTISYEDLVEADGVVPVEVTVAKAAPVNSLSIEFSYDSKLKALLGAGGFAEDGLFNDKTGIFVWSSADAVVTEAGDTVLTLDVTIPLDITGDKDGKATFAISADDVEALDDNGDDMIITVVAGSIVVTDIPKEEDTTPKPTTATETTPKPTTATETETETTPEPTTATETETTPEPTEPEHEYFAEIIVKYNWAEQGAFDIVIYDRDGNPVDVDYVCLYNGEVVYGPSDVFNGEDFLYTIEVWIDGVKAGEFEVLIAMRGDADLNGRIQAKDAVDTLKHAVGVSIGKDLLGEDEDFGDLKKFVANVDGSVDKDGNGTIRATDAVSILKYAVKASIGSDPEWDDIIG
jgi:cell division septation protein DedD